MSDSASYTQVTGKLINRQDAIDVARKCSVKEVTPAYMLIDKSEIMTELMLIPSAEPEERTKERTETHACDCISRQAAIDALDEIEAEVADGYGYQYAKWREYFVEMPSAQPKRKTGHWINSYKRQTCSICKQRGCRSWNFCPNCGADMKGDTYE